MVRFENFHVFSFIYVIWFISHELCRLTSTGISIAFATIPFNMKTTVYFYFKFLLDWNKYRISWKIMLHDYLIRKTIWSAIVSYKKLFKVENLFHDILFLL